MQQQLSSISHSVLPLAAAAAERCYLIFQYWPAAHSNHIIIHTLVFADSADSLKRPLKRFSEVIDMRLVHVVAVVSCDMLKA